MRRDGEDDDPKAAGRRRNLHATSRELRELLRKQGIIIDDEDTTAPVAPEPKLKVDRDAIRAVLAPFGVPEWMIASCPSIDLALEYAAKHQGDRT